MIHALIFAIFGAVLWEAVTTAHPGPPVVLDVRITTDEVRWTLRGEQETLHPWLGLEHPLDLGSGAQAETVARAVQEALLRDYVLTIDRERVQPRLASVRAPEASWFGGEPATEIELASPVKRLPSSVGVLWPARFDPELWRGQDMPVRFLCFGRHEFHALSEREPQCRWHAGRLERRRAGESAPRFEAGDPEPPSKAPSWPLWLLLPIWLATAGTFWLCRHRPSRWLLLPLLALLTGGAFYAAARLAAPQDDLDDLPMKERFAELQRRLYSAFDALDPEEAYDRLARSVHPAILDEEYQRLYESLLLREAGGVVCQVERIEVLAGELQPERPPPLDLPEGAQKGYWVRWHWRVHGRVAHWGHEHRRALEYRAAYWVARIEPGWRIAHTVILEQTRLETD